jgi:cytidine deaminase
MTNKEIKIAYKEFDSIDELESKDRKLAQAAIEATKLSYAPYSNFNVGAAVLFEDGEIVKGSNQENAAYPSGMCAERTALFYASASRPDKAMSAIAIAAGQNGVICDYPVTPCGACRQVMAQYQTKSGAPMEVLLVGGRKIWKFEKIDDLLPLIFDSI